MIASLLLALGVTLLAVLGLAAGVLLGRPPIRGSCGGLSCGACRDCPRHADRAARTDPAGERP